MSLNHKGPHGMAIEGLDEVVDSLANVLPKEARNLARSTVQNIAQEVAKGMKLKAPKDEGELRKSIIAYRRRGTPTQVASDVIIRHGKGQKINAFYWHFVENGTADGAPAQPYITPTVEEMRPKIPDIFRDKMGKNLEKLMARKAKKAATK